MLFEEGLIENLQAYRNPLLDVFFLFISILGTEYFFLSVSAVIYWSYDRKFGIQLAFLMLFSFWATLLFKDLFHMPRPNEKYRIEYPYFRYDETYGFPSGHAMNSVIFWYAFASWTKNKVVYIIGVLITVLVSISRIYLGFHFLGDVLGGLLFGSIFSVVYFYLKENQDRFYKFYKSNLDEWLSDMSINMFKIKIGLVIIFTIIFFFPFSVENIKIAGGFLGYAIGYTMTCRLGISSILDNAKELSKKEKTVRNIAGLCILAIFFIPISLTIYFLVYHHILVSYLIFFFIF
jgi:membrane-associated phospholipid phosphatase